MSTDELSKKLFLLRQENLPKMQQPNALIWESDDVFSLKMEDIDRVAKENDFDAPTVKLFHVVKLAADYKKEKLIKESKDQLEEAIKAVR
jgi:hypothetical protein